MEKLPTAVAMLNQNQSLLHNSTQASTKHLMGSSPSNTTLMQNHKANAQHKKSRTMINNSSLSSIYPNQTGNMGGGATLY